MISDIPHIHPRKERPDWLTAASSLALPQTLSAVPVCAANAHSVRSASHMDRLGAVTSQLSNRSVTSGKYRIRLIIIIRHALSHAHRIKGHEPHTLEAKSPRASNDIGFERCSSCCGEFLVDRGSERLQQWRPFDRTRRRDRERPFFGHERRTSEQRWRRHHSHDRRSVYFLNSIGSKMSMPY